MISDKLNTVFVHIPKTGGQSVELMFLGAHGLSWENRQSLLLRHTDDMTNGPQRLAHLYAKEYVGLGYMAAETYASYFKFAIVRDPYERLMSEYRYRPKFQAMSIDQFLGLTFDSDWSDEARHLVPQVNYVRDDQGKIIVDQIIRFETMKTEMPALTRRIFGVETALPHRNKSNGGKGFVSDLTPRQLQQVTDRYAADLLAFGYPERA